MCANARVFDLCVFQKGNRFMGLGVFWVSGFLLMNKQGVVGSGSESERVDRVSFRVQNGWGSSV